MNIIYNNELFAQKHVVEQYTNIYLYSSYITH